MPPKAREVTPPGAPGMLSLALHNFEQRRRASRRYGPSMIRQATVSNYLNWQLAIVRGSRARTAPCCRCSCGSWRRCHRRRRSCGPVARRRLGSPTHENVEQHFVAVDVVEGEALDPKPDPSKLRLQYSIDLRAADIREAVFSRECRLGHIHLHS